MAQTFYLLVHFDTMVLKEFHVITNNIKAMNTN